MPRLSRPIDDYTLAAFLAGALPAARRAEVIERLRLDADLRELMLMAYEAMHLVKEREPLALQIGSGSLPA